MSSASFPGLNPLLEATEVGYGGLEPSATARGLLDAGDVKFDRAPRMTGDQAVIRSFHAYNVSIFVYF